jgi:hypothetical protein
MDWASGVVDYRRGWLAKGDYMRWEVWSENGVAMFVRNDVLRIFDVRN